MKKLMNYIMIVSLLFMRYEVNPDVTSPLIKPINITIESEFVPPSLPWFDSILIIDTSIANPEGVVRV